MRTVVCVRQVYDPRTVKISRSREEFDLRGAIKIANPTDKYALEAALRLREAAGGDVVALAIGDASADDVVREAVAFGADRAVLVISDDPLSGKAVAAVASAALSRLGEVDLVLTGEASAVDGTGSLAPHLAAVLGWPIILDAAQLAADEAGLSAIVSQANGGARLPIAPPAVIEVVPGPERPRYPHPARIAVAWEPGYVECLSVADLGLGDAAVTADTEVGGLVLGPERLRGQRISGSLPEAAGELVSILRSKRII